MCVNVRTERLERHWQIRRICVQGVCVCVCAGGGGRVRVFFMPVPDYILLHKRQRRRVIR